MDSQWRPKREPDFSQFLRAIGRKQKPERLPVYEHLASPGFIATRLGFPLHEMPPSREYWTHYVDFWLGMGFDEVPLEIPLSCPLQTHQETAGKASRGSEATVTIRSMEDFERYPWPDLSVPIDFSPFEMAAQALPAGAKIVGGVGAGPYEWATYFMGVEGLSVALCVDPELVRALFTKLEALYTSAVRVLAGMECIGALRQGDDLGFKTSTFLPPGNLRELVLPIYTKMASEAHAAGKPFILHSCGNLGDLYEDLIEVCRIDAKHSFEDVILPVTEFKRRYGHRITPLGGLDVDVICQADENDLRAYARRIVEECFADGFWALGTGNSLTDYMPVEKYLVVLDEGLRVAGMG